MLLAASAAADTVFLVDGGSYKGKVRREGDKVIVEIPNGSITLDRARVARIEFDDDLFATLAERRRGLDSHDADGHYELGRWALANDMPGPARDLFTTAQGINPKHAGANLMLGWVFLDGSWVRPDQLVDILDRWTQGGQGDVAAQIGRQALAGLLSADDRRDLLVQTARAERRIGNFRQSEADYRELAAMLPPISEERQRLAALADLLAQHPTGLYLVYLDPFAGQFRSGEAGPSRSGYYSLSDDAVVQLALRDQAKALIEQGEQVMDQAKEAELGDSRRAMRLYSQAEESFVQADALETDIARSYRVEARRRRIMIHQGAAEAEALRFDGLNLKLAKAKDDRDKRAYVRTLQQMTGLLDSIKKELDEVLVLAGPYAEEFNLIITWTRQDMATVEQMRRTVRDELKDVGP